MEPRSTPKRRSPRAVGRGGEALCGVSCAEEVCQTTRLTMTN